MSSESRSTDITHNFVAGDVVEVIQDALVGLQGTVIKVDGNQVTIKAKHAELQVGSVIVHGYFTSLFSINGDSCKSGGFLAYIFLKF